MNSDNDRLDAEGFGSVGLTTADQLATIQRIIDRKCGPGNATASLDTDGVTVLVSIHAGAPATVTREGINEAIAGMLEREQKWMPTGATAKETRNQRRQANKELKPKRIRKRI